MSIAYRDLTNDFFVKEVKPDARVNGRVVFVPTGKEATIDIIYRQMHAT
jgi:hypothetical protein